MLATNPETFETIAKSGINLFHGVSANALINILNYGINSVDESLKKGIEVSTGEEWSRANGKRSLISLTDDLNTALEYTYSKDKEKETAFGMVIGMSSKDIEQLETYKISSDLPEIGVKDNIPLEYIKFIGVPEDKVEFVRKMVGNEPITVMPINIEGRFYWIDDIGLIEFYEEEAKKVIEEKTEPEKNFTGEEVKKLAKGRIKSKILRIYRKIKEKINSKGKEYERDCI